MFARRGDIPTHVRVRTTVHMIRLCSRGQCLPQRRRDCRSQSTTTPPPALPAYLPRSHTGILDICTSFTFRPFPQLPSDSNHTIDILFSKPPPNLSTTSATQDQLVDIPIVQCTIGPSPSARLFNGHFYSFLFNYSYLWSEVCRGNLCRENLEKASLSKFDIPQNMHACQNM